MTNTIVSKRVVVSGRVQGVSFRAFVKSHADRFNLEGFVRNRKDGTVEAVFVGDENPVNAMIALCHEGSPISHVERVDVSDWAEAVEQGFAELPTI